jgi:hypothetical protein
MDTDKQSEQWLKRLEATGRAQSRYLWITLVACLFFLALHSSTSGAQQISVPIVDLKLDSRAVLASGGTIVAFVVLASLGAIFAWSNALRQCSGESWREDAERLDVHPNALDLAIYTTSESTPLLRNVVRFVYPAYMTVALFESAWLQWWLWQNPAPARWFFVVAGALVWGRAMWLAARVWGQRIKALRSRAQVDIAVRAG